MLIIGTVIKPLLSVPHNHVCDTVTMRYCTLIKPPRSYYKFLDEWVYTNMLGFLLNKMHKLQTLQIIFHATEVI